MRCVCGWVMPKARSQSVSAQRSIAKATKAGVAARALADFDTQLMLQARSGNTEAANALIRRNFDRISRYVTRLVGRRGPVEDITQETFLRAISRAAEYEPRAKVITWLYRIATNIALNDRRRAHAAPDAAGLPEGSPEPPDRKAAPPDRQMSLDETRREVARVIADLPMNQRIAMTLFQYEELSYEQIAGVLDTSDEAVRGLLGRARTTLRRKLKRLA